jgi:hypothetical protein
MNNRRSAVKAMLLVAPLLLSTFVLHAWGDAMAGGLGRAVGSWQYPSRIHPPFVIRVPRRYDADVWAGPALVDFVQKAVKTNGALGLQVPAQPVTVVLLDPETDHHRFGTMADDPSPNQGVFDPARRMILVRMERILKQDKVRDALYEAAARLLLHDAGSARWSPWLTEGLVGRLEETPPKEWRALTGELPGVAEILKSTEADFNSQTRTAASKGARLLVAFLLDRLHAKFLAYYKDEQAGLRPSFSDLIGDPEHVEHDWKDWIQRLK